MTRIRTAAAGLVLTTTLLAGCASGSGSGPSAAPPEAAESSEAGQTPEQLNCVAADEFLPTLRAAQDGQLSEEERAQAATDFTTLLNDTLVDDNGGQVSAMLYVLAAALRDDATEEDRSKATFDDFHRQLTEYCEGFADWQRSN